MAPYPVPNQLQINFKAHRRCTRVICVYHRSAVPPAWLKCDRLNYLEIRDLSAYRVSTALREAAASFHTLDISTTGTMEPQILHALQMIPPQTPTNASKWAF